VLFTYLPLDDLKQLKPVAIFRSESARARRGWRAALTILAVMLAFLGLIVRRSLHDFEIGIWFVLGVAAFILAAALMAQAVLWALKRARIRSLTFRQALRGLFRPRNATRAILRRRKTIGYEEE
jgi:putative ABC transport system permease protein